MAKSYRAWFVALALTGFFLDQASKYLVFAWLHNHPTRYDTASRTGGFDIIPGGFKLHVQYTDQPTTNWLQRWSARDERPRVNHGALFGLGNQHEVAANYVFAGISVIAAIAIVLWSLRAAAAQDRLLCIALGLILAGTLGNLYDRLAFEGVRDFLYYFYLVDWPVFNIADCCLVCGAIVLLGQAFLAKPLTPDPAAPPAPEHAEASAGQVVNAR